MTKKKIVPLNHPYMNARFQDDFDHDQKSGASATSASTPTSSFGNAIDKTNGDTTAIPRRTSGPGFAGDSLTARRSRVTEDMRVSFRTIGLVVGAAVTAVVLTFTACGRGPVEPISLPNVPTITLELFVQGTITQSEGDYIFVLNENTGTAPNFVNLNHNAQEQPGEPTILEAYGISPAPFTHWDQAFLYGAAQSGLPNCALAPANSFFYCFKAVSQNGGQITIKFIPIVLTPGTFTFNPAGNGGSGIGNAIILRLPIACLSIFAGSDSQSCDTVTPNVTQIYFNLITLDSTGAPQDQLACIAGQSFPIDVSVTNTQVFTKSGCSSEPPNPDLQITGGLVQVTIPGSSGSPAPSPSPSPSPSA